MTVLLCTATVGSAKHIPSNYYESWEQQSLDGYTEKYNAGQYSEIRIESNTPIGADGDYNINVSANDGFSVVTSEGGVVLESNKTIDFAYNNGTLMNFWMKFLGDHTFNYGDTSGTGQVWSGLEVEDSSGNLLRVRVHQSSSGVVTYRIEGNTVMNNATSGEENTWQHWNVRYNNSKVRLYIDDKLELTTTNTSTFSNRQNVTVRYVSYIDVYGRLAELKADDIHIGDVNIRDFNPQGEQPNNPREEIDDPFVTFLELLNVREIQFIAIAAVLSAGSIKVSNSPFAGCAIFSILMAMGFASGFASLGVTISSILITLVILINLRNVAYPKR